MANLKLTPELVTILNAAEYDGNKVRLRRQLDPATYKKVNTALEAAGGKWSRKEQAHLFDEDPRHALGLILSKGEVVDVKKARQAFYTPPELALRVAKFANVEGHHVLEPSAGHGNLADACMLAGAKGVSVVEFDEDAFATLAEKQYIGIKADFLNVRPRNHFKRIVMNPPFTKGQDVKHIKRALQWLAPGGVLVTIIPDRFGIDSMNLVRVLDPPVGARITSVPLPPNSFKESGTAIATAMFRIALASA